MGEVFESMTTIYTLDPDRVDELWPQGNVRLRSREHWFGTRSLKAAFARKLLARVHREERSSECA